MAEFEAPDIKDIQQLFVHKPVIHVKGFQTFNPLQMPTLELEALISGSTVLTTACFMLYPTILIIIKLYTNNMNLFIHNY